MNEITIELRNREDLVFTGDEIAYVSSRWNDGPRWTEMRVYVTDDGGYVFRRTGRSVMYHRPTCRKIFGRMDLSLVDDPSDDHIPCDRCTPETDEDKVMLESDKEFARKCSTAAELFDAVQEPDRVTHRPTLTDMGRSILMKAAEVAPEITTAVQERMVAAASGQ